MTDQPDPARSTPPSRRPPRGGGGREGRRDGDVLAGPADSTRPANPWPRLLAFGLGVAALVVLAGLCVSSFASAPNREIRVRDSEYQPALPKFLAVPSFGADGDGRTYGAYLVVDDAEQVAAAFFSRAPHTGCNVRWDGTARYEDGIGLFLDPCSDARFDIEGRAMEETSPVDLHQFEARREANSYVVSFDDLILGTCRDGDATGCSPEGEQITRDVPSGELPDDFAVE